MKVKNLFISCLGMIMLLNGCHPADQSGELADLELAINTWGGEWDGGSR